MFPQTASSPPKRTPRARSRPGSDRPPSPGQPPHRSWALVIDDDHAILSLVRHVLIAAGLELDVVTATSGPIALDLLLAVGCEQPDVIVLDLDLPGLHGRVVARRYARLDVPHAPILVCSAAPDAAEIGASFGAAGVLRKPFDVDELVDLASALVRTSRAA